MKYKFIIELEISEKVTVTKMDNLKRKINKIPLFMFSSLIHQMLKNDYQIKDSVITRIERID